MTLDQLKLSDAVYLHALMSARVRGRGILHASPLVVAPNESFYWHMLGVLERQGAVVTVAAARSAGSRGLHTRHFELGPGLDADSLKDQLTDHLKAARQTLAAVTQYSMLWVDLGIAELHAYLEWELASHHFETRWCDELMPTLERGLLSFSIGQMFYFCWTAVRDLASHHLRHSAPLQTYKDYLSSSMEAKIERAVRDGWEVRQYSRQWRRRSNAVAETFSGHATGLGERFLIEVPSREALASLF